MHEESISGFRLRAALSDVCASSTRAGIVELGGLQYVEEFVKDPHNSARLDRHRWQRKLDGR